MARVSTEYRFSEKKLPGPNGGPGLGGRPAWPYSTGQAPSEGASGAQQGAPVSFMMAANVPF